MVCNRTRRSRYKKYEEWRLKKTLPKKRQRTHAPKEMEAVELLS
jgi:hypothetical protein